jgi:hypothetical protein
MQIREASILLGALEGGELLSAAPARFIPVHADDDEIDMTFMLKPMRV